MNYKAINNILNDTKLLIIEKFIKIYTLDTEFY